MKYGISPRRLRVLLPMLLWFCVGPALSASRHAKKHAPPPKVEQPSVQRTDPPNWWSGLPNPMLLLNGKNLSGAHVTSSVPGISVRRTRVSANGHWVFVWLDIAAAPAQKLELVVRTPGGEAHVPYALEQRHAPMDGFQGFSSADVIYRILPENFENGDQSKGPLQQSPRAYHGGNLRGIAGHLDYLQQLGVTTVSVPLLYANGATAAGEDHGQDAGNHGTGNMYGVNPHLGTLQDYEDMAQALHSHNMKLVLDAALNHVGPKNPWLLDPPAPEWFHGTLAHHLEANGDFAAITDPHASPAAYRPVVDGWVGNVLSDLNQSNPQVKEYLIQNAIWWIESGALDGLRLDAFPYVDRVFWEDFHSELHALYPHLTMVGEISNPDPTIVSYFAGGAKHGGIDTGLYTPFDFPTFFVLRATLTGTAPTGDASMTRLADVQRQDWLYPHPERLVTFLGNRDAGSFLSQPGATAARVKLAFGLLATMRGMPQIDSGDEIALAGGFSGDKNDAFTAAGRTPQQEAMHAWVQGLLQLRAHHEVLQSGAQQDLLVDDTGFVFARMDVPASGKASAALAQGEIVLVLMNKADAPRTFHLDFSRTALQGIASLAPAWNAKETVTVEHNQCDVNVGAEQLMVLSAQR